MIRITALPIIVFFLMVTIHINGQSIIINEVNQQGQWVELYNASITVTTDVSSWQLCNFPTYDVISGNLDVNIISGSTMMTPGSYLVLGWSKGINSLDGELALYVDGSFNTQSSIRDYMQYGSGNHQRAGFAVNEGYWDDITAFVPNAMGIGNSLLMTDGTAMDATDTDSSNWEEGTASQGSSNGGGNNNPCPQLLVLNDDPITPDTYRAIQIESAGRIAGGQLTLGETAFLAEDDIEMKEEFQVDNGGILIASIEDCP